MCAGRHCAVNRRQFLSSLALLTGAGMTLGAESAASASDVDAHVDVRTLRPRPKVKVLAAILRLPTPYWLGWPGTSYDLPGHQKEYTQALRQAGQDLGVHVEVLPVPIENEQGMAAFLERVGREKPDAAVAVLQHISCWDWAGRLAATGTPTIIFSPIGTSFTGHVQGISRQPGVHVISSLEIEGIRQAVRMVRAKRQLEDTRLLWIVGDRRGESVLPNVGVKVRQVPRRVFREYFERMPENAEARQVAQRMADAAQRIVEPTKADRLNAARTYTAAKLLLSEERAHGLSMDCLGMVAARIVPTPPCGAWSLLQDSGVTCGCEADLFAAVSMMFVSYLLDRPGFINDPVAETVKNRLIASHCSSGTRLHGWDKPPVPIILRSHSESDIGVSTQVLWPEGEKCTLVRFTGPDQIIVDTGTVSANVNTPPAGGCRTSFEITMDRMEDARDVLGFHQVVVAGDHRRSVEAYAQMYGLGVIHSPERAPEHERGRNA
jgi:hypothetical protein